jgi:CRISPR/Cas system CMR-associated protein Cmr3 (group 5 of RAMP superfamily)
MAVNPGPCKKEDENILQRFERKIIRRIYSPVRQGGEWRIRNNEEIDNIIRKKDIVRFVKARRINWISHVERMEDSRKRKRVMKEKMYTRRKMGRPKVRWLDDIQEDLREMEKESSG